MQFKDVIAPQEVKNQLLKQVHDHRISHAQFYLAHPGSHAFALALAMGQYLCCEHPTDTDSCGECPSCIQFSKLSHPDLHIYFPNCTTKEVKSEPDSILLANDFRNYVLDNNFHIDISSWVAVLSGENKQPAINIRDCSHIINQNSTRSYMGGYKIYILWNVDRLNVAAAPKLLKTLEEPENQSLFILISEKPDQMLSTILSRTQMVKIPRISEQEMAYALLNEFPDLNPVEANNIAILADGNYIKAVQILKEGSEESELLSSFDIMMGSVFSFATSNGSIVDYESVAQEFEKIASKGREVQKTFVNLILRMLHNILMLSNGQGAYLKTTDQERSVLEKYANKLNIKHLSLMAEECNKALQQLIRNGNANIVFADLFFKLTACLK